jgi:putative tryptophan/tyrosine transport system substrate-binding protein
VRLSHRGIYFCLAALLWVFDFPAEAQQPLKVPRIGYIAGVARSTNPVRIEAFRQGLRELGYEEGKNIIIEQRYASGKVEDLPALAAELVQLKVDVIVTGGPTVTRVVKEATATTPIVMAQDPDPVSSGLVVSLRRPGGNITGLSSLAADLSGKRLELLKEILPKLSRAAVFLTSTNTGNAQQLRETEVAAAALGVELQQLDVLAPKDIETVFQAASKGRADAVIVLNSSVTNSYRKQITKLAVERRLPAIYWGREYVEDGGLSAIT